MMRVLGLMSGTSVDGIDAVLAEIDRIDGEIQLTQIAFAQVPWSPAERRLIFELFENRANTQMLCQANFTLGEGFARAALTVIEEAGLSPQSVHLIGSHGQTVWHEVAEDGRVLGTLQIGEAAVIAERTGITTVSDFRVADVAAGGQGAPLVPIFDWLLLRPSTALGGWRAVQNIGGIGNVTFLPPLSSDAAPLAFDTGPGNVLIDRAVALLSGGERHFDADGAMAATGRISGELLEEWLDLAYFSQPPPKSTGRELFTQRMVEEGWQQAQQWGLSPSDFVATVTELTAASIADAYGRFAPGPVAEVVIGGGGGRNPMLLSRIAAHLQMRFGRAIPVLRHRDLAHPNIDDDAKEALAFALLAWLTVHGQPGNIPSCTGAHAARVLGKIALGCASNGLKELL